MGQWLAQEQRHGTADLTVFAGRIMWNGLLAPELIDERHLTVGPVALAAGLPLFLRPAELSLMEARPSAGSDSLLLRCRPARTGLLNYDRQCPCLTRRGTEGWPDPGSARNTGLRESRPVHHRNRKCSMATGIAVVRLSAGCRRSGPGDFELRCEPGPAGRYFPRQAPRADRRPDPGVVLPQVPQTLRGHAPTLEPDTPAPQNRRSPRGHPLRRNASRAGGDAGVAAED